MGLQLQIKSLKNRLESVEENQRLLHEDTISWVSNIYFRLENVESNIVELKNKN